MRKIFIILFTIVPVFLFAQERITWSYPVKPRTDEWNSLKTENERINAMQIPKEVLNKMSTSDLIDACINFPLFGYYSAFNSPLEGFNIMFSRFNVFHKICEKDSVGQYFIKIYSDATMKGWEKLDNKFDNEFWTLKLAYIEYLISQKEIIYKLNEPEKFELLKIARTKFYQKKTHESFNSIPGISSSLLLMSRILYFDMVRSSLPEQKNVQNFIETGVLNDAEVIDEILNSTEQYLTR